ncbi:MAG: hypothetical protein MK097_20320, partial [Dechloromonas sp.]|nr:hypothetical protein [Dechloromonas sp.]
LELELAIKRGNGDEAKRLLGEIRGAHLNEPGVAEATYRMLYSAGLIAADQTAPTELPEHARATAGAEPSAIWTPDAKVPSPKRDIDGTSHSAIWTP